VWAHHELSLCPRKIVGTGKLVINIAKFYGPSSRFDTMFFLSQCHNEVAKVGIVGRFSHIWLQAKYESFFFLNPFIILATYLNHV